MAKAETFKIDKNIPFPTKGLGRRSMYPWGDLSTGDSFVYDGPINNAQAASTYHSSVTNKTFKARKLNGDVRVWRVK